VVLFITAKHPVAVEATTVVQAVTSWLLAAHPQLSTAGSATKTALARCCMPPPTDPATLGPAVKALLVKARRGAARGDEWGLRRAGGQAPARAAGEPPKSFAPPMIPRDQAYVMLLVEVRFKDFTKKPICDSTTATETILALSADSRTEVDDLVDKALAAGGKPANDPIDLGFMYGRSFQDVDGHLWEVIYLDPSALEQ
jgi:predicted lactoylglutathione lyase